MAAVKMFWSVAARGYLKVIWRRMRPFNVPEPGSAHVVSWRRLKSWQKVPRCKIPSSSHPNRGRADRTPSAPLGPVSGDGPRRGRQKYDDRRQSAIG
eukprot:symbB.v1.2.021002.t1/scaffold1794.1/size101098/9